MLIVNVTNMNFVQVLMYGYLLCSAHGISTDEIDLMKIQMQELQSQVHDQRQLAHAMANQIQSQGKTIKQLERVIEDLSTASRLNSPVAFTVSHSVAQTVQQNQKFQFDTIHINAGGGFASPYDFTCPVSGYYIFSASVFRNGSNYATIRIDVNGVRGPKVHTSVGSGATAVYAAHCGSGEKVSVVSDHATNIPSNAGADLQTWFSGILIAQI